MKMLKHIQTWLLIMLLALSASGVVSAKVVSGGQNLNADLHQSQTVLNALLHQGLEEVSTTDTSESPLAAKGGDKFSRAPKSIQDQMTLEAAKKGAGRKVIGNLNDPKFKGMDKFEYKVKSKNGQDSVVHYVRDPKTGQGTDFKFKKHSTQDIKPMGNDKSVKPGG